MAKDEKTKAAEANTKNAETDAKEAKTLGVKKSKIKMSGFSNKDPQKKQAEEDKHKLLAAKRVKNRLAKAKEEAAMKPIDKRLALLIGRFKAIVARARTYTYSNKNVEAWTEEYNMIKSSPKSWISLTANGTKPFVPGNIKKKTAKEVLDGMDLNN